MWSLFVIMALLVPGEPAEKKADPAMDAMKALPSLAGRWEGGGWMKRGKDETFRFVGEERVEQRLDGRLLLVEGRHFAADKSRVVHHAFAVISWDEASKGYRFRSYLADGKQGDFAARMEGDALIWEMPTPSGMIRYTITVGDGKWKEVGHMQRGDQWYQFFEMNLDKVSD